VTLLAFAAVARLLLSAGQRLTLISCLPNPPQQQANGTDRQTLSHDIDPAMHTMPAVPIVAPG